MEEKKEISKKRSDATRQSYIDHPELREMRSRHFKEVRIGKPSWNKDIRGEEYLKHFRGNKSWNKGLTKETDERVKKYSLSKIGKSRPLEVRMKVSETRKRKFASGETVCWCKGKHNEALRITNLINPRKKSSESIEKAKATYRRNYLNKIPSNLEELYIKKNLTCREIAMLFGAKKGRVRNWLIAKKIQIRPNLFGKRELKFTCDDGHIVQSGFEREVDNWLYSHRITHSIHNRISERRHFKCDFKVGDVFVECDGLEEQRLHLDRFKEKIDLYKELGLNYVILTMREDINTKLSALFMRYSKIQKNLDKFVEVSNAQTI